MPEKRADSVSHSGARRRRASRARAPTAAPSTVSGGSPTTNRRSMSSADPARRRRSTRRRARRPASRLHPRLRARVPAGSPTPCASGRTRSRRRARSPSSWESSSRIASSSMDRTTPQRVPGEPPPPFRRARTDLHRVQLVQVLVRDELRVGVRFEVALEFRHCRPRCLRGPTSCAPARFTRRLSPSETSRLKEVDEAADAAPASPMILDRSVETVELDIRSTRADTTSTAPTIRVGVPRRSRRPFRMPHRGTRRPPPPGETRRRTGPAASR